MSGRAPSDAWPGAFRRGSSRDAAQRRTPRRHFRTLAPRRRGRRSSGLAGRTGADIESTGMTADACRHLSGRHRRHRPKRLVDPGIQQGPIPCPRDEGGYPPLDFSVRAAFRPRPRHRRGGYALAQCHNRQDVRRAIDGHLRPFSCRHRPSTIGEIARKWSGSTALESIVGPPSSRLSGWAGNPNRQFSQGGDRETEIFVVRCERSITPISWPAYGVGFHNRPQSADSRFTVLPAVRPCWSHRYWEGSHVARIAISDDGVTILPSGRPRPRCSSIGFHNRVRIAPSPLLPGVSADCGSTEPTLAPVWSRLRLRTLPTPIVSFIDVSGPVMNSAH